MEMGAHELEIRQLRLECGRRWSSGAASSHNVQLKAARVFPMEGSQTLLDELFDEGDAGVGGGGCDAGVHDSR